MRTNPRAFSTAAKSSKVSTNSHAIGSPDGLVVSPLVNSTPSIGPSTFTASTTPFAAVFL